MEEAVIGYRKDSLQLTEYNSNPGQTSVFIGGRPEDSSPSASLCQRLLCSASCCNPVKVRANFPFRPCR